MERTRPYLEVPLADGRMLLVGHLANISTTFPGEGDTFAMVHRLGCLVTAAPNQEPGERSIVRADGSVAADKITVAEAVALAPESGVEIVNAAADLLSDYYRLAESIRTSTELRDRLVYEYVARYGPALRAEIGEAAVAAREIATERRAAALLGGHDGAGDGETEPFAAFRLHDGRTLTVGPYINYAGESIESPVDSFDDAEAAPVEMPIHALMCTVSVPSDAIVGARTLVDAGGTPVAEPVTLEEAATWLHDIAPDVVAAARILVEQTLSAVDRVRTSYEPEHALFRQYVAANLPGFTRDLKAAEKVVLARAHAEMERGTGIG